MIPGTMDPAVAANPPGGDLYFASAAALASPGVPHGPEGYNRFGTTGYADNLRLAPLVFETERNTGGKDTALASNAGAGGHVKELLNFRGSPAPWIGLALLLLFGILLISAEVRLKAPGGRRLGGEVVL